MKLMRAIATVGVWTLCSRVLGFVRDVMLAHVLGAGMLADVFFIAFKFPNLFRRLFGEGAMSAAFVPLYSGRLEREGPDSAKRFGADATSVLLGFMLIFCLLAMGAMPLIMRGIAPGFTDDPEKFALTVALGRIAFPYLLFMALSALFAGMLNAHGRFAAAAAAPMLLNLVLIGVLLLLWAGVIDAPGYGLVYGVVLAGALQFLALAWACWRAGIMFRLPRPRLTPGVRRLLLLMAPAAVGAGVAQINSITGDMLATLLAEGSVSYLYYADRVNQLPLGVVGVSVGVGLLPMLSRALKAGQEREAGEAMNRALEVSLLLTLPAAAALIIMPLPVIATLFGRGAFGPETARATADALQAFAIGLPAYVLVKALAPGFFAREDTCTPVIVGGVMVLLNVILALLLMQVLAHVGIALATAISAWVNAGLLFAILVRRGHFSMDARLRARLWRMLFSCAVMAAGLLAGMALLSAGAPVQGPWLPPGGRLPVLLLLVGIGATLYFAAAHISGAADLRLLLRQGHGNKPS